MYEVGKDPSAVFYVGIDKSAAGVFVALCSELGFDFAKAFAVGKLSECCAMIQELTGEAYEVSVVLVVLNDMPKGGRCQDTCRLIHHRLLE
jgi:hypothetical protein